MLDSNLFHPVHRDDENVPFRGEPIDHAYAREVGGAYFVLPGRRATLHALPPAPLQFPSLEHLDARVERLLRDAAGTRGLRPTTIQWARGAYGAFRQHVKSANCETEFLRGDLGAQCSILKAWIGALRGRGVTHVSVNSYWRGLRCLFRWLSEEEGTANPLIFLPAPRAGRIVPRALTEAAAVSILRFVRNYTWSSALERTRNSVIVGLMLLAGLRLGEVVKLLNGDLDEETGGIRIARGKGQGGGKDRTAYMSPQLRGFVRDYRAARHAAHRTHPEFLTALHANRAVGRAVVTNLLRLASRSTGVRVSPHMLRHTYATLLRQRGTQDRVAMELLGHSSLAMLQRYSHIFDGEASAAADRLRLEF